MPQFIYLFFIIIIFFNVLFFTLTVHFLLFYVCPVLVCAALCNGGAISCAEISRHVNLRYVAVRCRHRNRNRIHCSLQHVYDKTLQNTTHQLNLAC